MVQITKTSATKVTVTKGTKCAAPSKFNGEDLELLAFMKKYTWFKTSKNTANNIQIKISDLTVISAIPMEAMDIGSRLIL